MIPHLGPGSSQALLTQKVDLRPMRLLALKEKKRLQKSDKLSSSFDFYTTAKEVKYTVFFQFFSFFYFNFFFFFFFVEVCFVEFIIKFNLVCSISIVFICIYIYVFIAIFISVFIFIFIIVQNRIKF